MKTVALYGISTAKRIAFVALFAALCCVSGALVVVPLPNGYFNTGDVFVLLSAWCLGPLYGSLAAAIGGALTDLLTGYALYAPATFVIKGIDALAAYAVWTGVKRLLKRERAAFLPRVFSAVAGEICMVLGYFLFECILYGIGGATLSLAGNALQGGCCCICATLLVCALYPIKAIKNLFPALRK